MNFTLDSEVNKIFTAEGNSKRDQKCQSFTPRCGTSLSFDRSLKKVKSK